MSAVANKVGVAARMGLGLLPDRLSHAFRPRDNRFELDDVPPPVLPPLGDTRLYIAPANFAAQGYRWARAVEGLPGVGAVNMQYREPGDFGFPADYALSKVVFENSGSWARRQRDAVSAGFTHVVFESERPIFGLAFQGSVEREARWLQHRGLRVGLASHGSDLRLPSRHAEIDRWSPFRDLDSEWIRRLEVKALSNRALCERLDVPTFVATPELLLDWPSATWLPNVIDPSEWRSDRPALAEGAPVVLHAPTNPLVKGTALVEPVLDALDADGIIDYQRIIKVPAAEMPGRYAAADVVLDQFALGIYSTTSVEAMAAGRVVIAHLHDQVRDHIRATTGLEPPIVEATPDTLGEILRDVALRPDHYREIALRGPEYVRRVHNGELSARALAPFLGKPSA